jgi:branched-chain amino acid transport system substrate-binding protein
VNGVINGFAVGITASAVAHPAFGVPETIKIGLVGPKTGRLALFFEEMGYAVEHARKAMNNSININGTIHPLEFVIKDSQSSSNRASEVTQQLILKDKVHIVTTFATSETVNPVADQCELNGVPCLSNVAPMEGFFFGRHGNPKKGFDWTYHFFFTSAGLLNSMMSGWSRMATNKTLGVLWANDDDGRILAPAMTPIFQKSGFKVVDPGRFDLPANNFSPEIDAFKSNNAELVYAGLPSPDFTVFFNQAAQLGFKPKVITAGKADEFPQGVYPYGDRAVNFLTEVWWSKYHPHSSGITSQSSMELTEQYEKTTNQQASMNLGFCHSLIEVAVDTLKRIATIDNPASIRDALKSTDYKSVVGAINFKTGPLPNCSETKNVTGQWRKGKKWPLELVLVDNSLAPDVPVQGVPEPMIYS